MAAQKNPMIPSYMRFVMGGSAGMLATCFVQPLDLVKNRMQMSGVAGVARTHKTSLHAVVNILRTEGFFGVYNGLSAGLLRQASYTTTRLGVFTSLMEKFKNPDGSPPSFLKKLGIEDPVNSKQILFTAGMCLAFVAKLYLNPDFPGLEAIKTTSVSRLSAMTAGGVGSFIGTPAEISLIRMTSDGRLPPAEQRRYKNVFDALIRIVREEGVLTLWRGCIPTVCRAMVVNAAQLVTYAQTKQSLLSTGYFKDNIICHFVASMISGFATAFASMPPDIAKTRIQNMKIIDGKPEYRGAIHVLSTVIRKEGIFSLWKGFTPCYLRIGPHTVLTFIFLEQFTKVAKSYYGVQ